MAIEIRNGAEDDIAAAVNVISTGFLERPDIRRMVTAMREVWDPSRMWLAWDGPTACGTFRSWGTEITLPGLGRLPASAVSAVTVLPTHRRRGILTQMAAAEHRALRERGEAMALLYASEFGIYGRFGYGPATRSATWTVDLTRTRIPGPPEDAGTVELATPDPAVRDEVRRVYEEWHPSRIGQLRRQDFTWDLRLGLKEEPWGETWKGWLALHRDGDGRIDGFARYKAQPSWEGHVPKTALEVQELVGLTEASEAALWAFLGSVDLVASLKAEGLSPSDRLPWRLANGRAAQLSDLGDGLWVRLFDVPRSLAARSYEREGSVVLDVVDEDAAGGRWRVALQAGPDGATCATTSRSADLTLSVAALGSVYLGAHDLRDVALRARVDEHRDGALARAAGLFRTAREPWCATFF